MKGKNQNPEDLELRVIEDERRADEVVRLDEEELVESDPQDLPKKIKKQESHDVYNAMLGDLEEEQEQEHLLDQEAEWIQEVAKNTDRAIPMGWFFLVIGGIGLVLIWGVYSMWTADSPTTKAVVEESSSVDRPIGKKAEMMQRKDAEIYYESLENLVRDYFAAKTVEEKLQYLRHKERVKPLMEDYYSRISLEPREYMGIDRFHVISLNNLPFVAVRAQFSQGVDEMLLLEDSPEGLLVDWESDVCYQSYPFEKFIRERPEQAEDFRVYVTVDNFYSYDFNEDDWLSFKITTRDSNDYLFAYVKRKTPLAERILDVTRGRSPKTSIKKRPLLLRLRFPPGGEAPRSVLIEKIVSERWAYGENPEGS